MLNIAICDDTIADLSNMVSHISSYQTNQIEPHSLKYTTFQNAMDLIASMEGGQQYDLVFLDIIMPFMTGMEAAKEIRQFNQNIKIIFSTSSSEFAVESYAVDAYYYYLKPVCKEKLFPILDELISDIALESSSSHLIKSNIGLTKIYNSKLEFAEIIGRTVLYHLTDGSILEANGSMTELEKALLIYPCFIKPHRSYIINMDHIDTLRQREIKMQSLALVPIAKAKYSAVKAAYITFTFTV